MRKVLLIALVTFCSCNKFPKVHATPNYIHDQESKNIKRLAEIAGDRGAFIVYKLKVDSSEYIIAKSYDGISIIKNK